MSDFNNLTKEMFGSTAPFDTSYQGCARRYLFVCSAGLLRSPTAARIAQIYGINARSCGSSSYALIPLSVNLIEWAHKIIFMNTDCANEALQTFDDEGYGDVIREKMEDWEIGDSYEYMNPRLVDIIERKLTS